MKILKASLISERLLLQTFIYAYFYVLNTDNFEFDVYCEVMCIF